MLPSALDNLSHKGAVERGKPEHPVRPADNSVDVPRETLIAAKTNAQVLDALLCGICIPEME